MPFGKRYVKPVARRSGMARVVGPPRRTLRAARVANNRAISVASGVGRNMVRRKLKNYRRPKTRFQRAVQRVIFGTTERKYTIATVQGPAGSNLNYNGTPWYHNTLAGIYLWDAPGGAPGLRLMPAQGTGDSTRIGDEIYITGIKVKLVFNLPSDRRTTSLKCWFVQWDSKQGSPTSYIEFFNPGSGNGMLDTVNSDRFPGVKMLGVFKNNDPDNTTTNAHGQIYVDVWIPIKRKVTFNNDGVQAFASGIKEYGALVFLAYDKIGTLTTDQVVNNMQGNVTMYFKDP